MEGKERNNEGTLQENEWGMGKKFNFANLVSSSSLAFSDKMQKAKYRHPILGY